MTDSPDGLLFCFRRSGASSVIHPSCPQHVINGFLQIFRIGVPYVPRCDDVHLSDKLECFDYSETGLKGQNRIAFHFVTDEGAFPSSRTVFLGDTDPMTGERITDLTVFREYHLQRNREIYYNKKAVSVPQSGKKKNARHELRERIAADFVRDYGYAPDSVTLNWLLHEKYPRQYRLEIDSFINENSEYWGDCVAEFADPAAEQAFRAVEEEGHTLDDFEKTLSPFLRDIFRMLRMKSEGINVRGMGNQLAEKWGVGKSDISWMKLRIGKLLKKWMEE